MMRCDCGKDKEIVLYDRGRHVCIDCFMPKPERKTKPRPPRPKKGQLSLPIDQRRDK